jgi:hypothetical protein
MNTIPSYTLEVRAVEERKRLNVDIEDLKARVQEKLDRKKTQLRRGSVVFRRFLASVLLLAAYGAARRNLWGRKRATARLLIAVVASLLAWPISTALTQENSSENMSDNPPARVARVSYLKGNVSFLRAGLDQWSQASLNFPVTTGDRIYTDHGARAELEVGSSAVRLSESTDLTVTNLSDQVMQLSLEQGTVRLSIYYFPSSNTVEVDTPNGALTIQDRGKYRVETDPSGATTLVAVFSGSLEISDEDISQTLRAGEAARLIGQDPQQVESVPMPAPDHFDEWSDERDRRIESSGSAKYVNPYTPGFSDLDEYGHWVEVADYGPVWYPVVAAGWVPYRLGHWVWIDPWGWSWIEDEPWGFCPFHFGRWALIGSVWGWIPGPFAVVPVYTPALVAFLGGPGFGIGVNIDLVGWFPLGPVDPFFPWYHYTGDYLRVVNITNVRNVTNITNVLNATDVHNIHYAYRTVAATAVPKDVFGSGQPVAHHAVKLHPQQLERAQVTPHPPVNPTARAAMPGKPVPAPPVRNPHPLAAARAAGPPAPPESSTRIEPHARPPVGEPRLPPHVIARTPPPPPVVPFEQRRPAMVEHPGRPLEPPQVDDLRAGRPVGPMRDREFPPHAAPVLREAPAQTRPPHR